MVSVDWQGIDQTLSEKIERLFTLLHRLYSVEFLKKRLSFYGGTALQSIHFDMRYRLSVDLDFNFRERDEHDWGEVRKGIDERIKSIIVALGYEDFRIQPTYPMARFDLKYKTREGSIDSLKIEIGYMRRIPFTRDVEYSLTTGITPEFGLTSPLKEELFANKIATFLSRGTGRDLFDVHLISKSEFNHKWLRKILLLENVAVLSRPLFDIDVKELIDGTAINQSLTSLLLDNPIPQGMKSNSLDFIRRLVDDLTTQERKFLTKFYDDYEFKPALLELEIANEDVDRHPAILWKLMNMNE